MHSMQSMNTKPGNISVEKRLMGVVGIAFFSFVLYNMLSNGIFHGHSRGRTINLYADDWLFYLLLPATVLLLYFSIKLIGETSYKFTKTHALLALLGISALLALSTYDRYSIYSTQAYWQTASIEDVAHVPINTLATGNKHGSVLMWAAAGTDDPAVLTALITRGANVDEEDTIYGGTALSAAAIETGNPAVIDVLIGHGANVNRIIGKYNKTPLLLAAELNHNALVIERLLSHGADLSHTDSRGENALTMAISNHNSAALSVLQPYYSSLEANI